MIRIFEYEIVLESKGQTILQFLKKKGYSRGVIRHLKNTPDGILRNTCSAAVNEVLATGDHLTIRLAEISSNQKITPVCLPLAIAYEDEDILIVNKEAGMPAHPSLNHYLHTLANAAVFYFHSDDSAPFVYRCINRLDKDTSGLTIIAKHMLSASILGKAAKNRLIRREYHAIVQGKVKDCGTICAPISRKPDSIIERMVDFDQGEHAVTHYRRLKYENGLSLVSLIPETGRTHQIRVHMQYIGHPLIGDFLYHPASREMKRQALHAGHLSFLHPITGKSLSVTAPVPQDFILRP